MKENMARTVFRANSLETYCRETSYEGTEQLAIMMKLIVEEFPGIVSDLRELNDYRRREERHGKAAARTAETSDNPAVRLL